MIIVDCAQGSSEWLRSRAGRQTASNFHRMRASKRMKRAPRFGDWSDDQRDLAWQIAMESINGAPLAGDVYETWQMRRGHALEPEARREHENQLGLIVERVGFVMTDDGKFGCSLDGRIDPKGAAEYKCLIAPTQLRKVLQAEDHGDYMDQCQGGLWITGREWIDLCFYCPFLRAIGKQLLVRRVYRDDNYIAELERDLLEFRGLIDESIVQIKDASLAGWFQQQEAVVAKALHVPAEAPVAGLALSEFERAKNRVANAASIDVVRFVLDGANFALMPDEYAEVFAAAKARFPEIAS